jgi:serine/threonine-protein kinase
VLSQTPPDGQLLPGQTVTLVLSKGPELVPVPNVVGQQAGAATAILEQAGFSVRRKAVFGGCFGTVRFQSPGGGRAPKGSEITITLV